MREHWIRVHGGLFEKPVVTRLSEAAHITKHEAVGVLVTFWSAVSSNATNGQVACYSDSQLETWAKWSRKRGVFAAWVRAHHVDEDGRVREWDEYQGPLEYRREADRHRKAAERVRRKSAGSPQDVVKTSAPTRANDTERNGKTTTTTARGCEVLLDQLTGSRLTAFTAKIDQWSQGYDLPPGVGVPTFAQIDAACLDALASCELGNLSPKVVLSFLLREMRGETIPQPSGRKPESLIEALSRPGGAG